GYSRASGNSNSNVGRRWPDSNRDSVLSEIPVAEDRSANVRSCCWRRARSRGPTVVSTRSRLASAEVVASDPHEADGRRVIFLYGDDASAKAAVAELFDAPGFSAIDLGDLIPGGRMQRVGGPLAGHNLGRRPRCR